MGFAFKVFFHNFDNFVKCLGFFLAEKVFGGLYVIILHLSILYVLQCHRNALHILQFLAKEPKHQKKVMILHEKVELLDMVKEGKSYEVKEVKEEKRLSF